MKKPLWSHTIVVLTKHVFLSEHSKCYHLLTRGRRWCSGRRLGLVEAQLFRPQWLYEAGLPGVDCLGQAADAVPLLCHGLDRFDLVAGLCPGCLSLGILYI